MKAIFVAAASLAAAMTCPHAWAADVRTSAADFKAASNAGFAMSGARTFDLFGPSSALATMPDARLLQTSGTAGDSSAAALAEISAGTADSRATLKIADTIAWQSDHDLSNPARPDPTAPDVWTLGLDTWSLTISAPVDKSATTTAILASGGLPSDFLAKFSFSQFRGSVTENQARQIELFRQALALRDACLASIPLSKFHPDDATKATDAETNAWKFTQKLTCEPPPPTDPAVTNNARALIAFYLPKKDQIDYDRGAVGSAFLWGVEASVGYQKFDFFDAVTALKNSNTGTPWSAKGYVAWSPDSAVLGLIGLEYQRSFKAAMSGSLCPLPSPAPPVLTCVTGAIGAPKQMDKLLASFELKREFDVKDALGGIGVSALGVDAKFAYDTKSDVYSFDLPLSFAMDDKKNLVGGIDFGWNSDKHDFVVGLFLSSAFSLFPG